MIKSILDIENSDIDSLKKSLPNIDHRRVSVDTTDYSCFTNLYNILKENVTDPRRTSYGNVKYDFWEVLTIIIICTMFGINKIKYIFDYAQKKANEFKLFLKLENGMPKYDTYLRAIHNASDTEIAISRKKWLDSLTIPKVTSEDEKFVYQGKEISINAQDGKTIIGSGCISQGIRPSHIITNINTETGEILGEIEVDKKTNEIKGNLELIENIPSLNGVLITLDAIGCQKNLGNAINGKGGLFLFQVKKNQIVLYYDIIFAFENKYTKFDSEFEKNRNRYERRDFFYSDDIKYIPVLSEWNGVKSYGLIRNITIVNGTITVDYHAYIMNFSDKNLFIKAARAHWYVENNLHYIEDTVYEEDKCKVRKGNGPKVLNSIRKFGVEVFSRISSSLNKVYGVKRLVNFSRNSLSDLADILSGNLDILFSNSL